MIITLDNGGIIHSQETNNIIFAEMEDTMTQLQIKDYLEKAETITKKAISSKAEARKLLAKGGFCTKNGKLKKEYRDK